MGVYDDNNPLSKFRGMRYLIKSIWEYTMQFNRHYYSRCIKHPSSSYNSFNRTDTAFHEVRSTTSCSNYTINPIFEELKFPKPLKKEININMMPVLMDPEKFKSQLPSSLKGYIQFLHACLFADPSQNGKICYLTIHESYVEKGKTQRRPGLHIELPGSIAGKCGGQSTQYYGWGSGKGQRDGIFMATNCDNTCAAWNVMIYPHVNTDHMDDNEMVNIEYPEMGQEIMDKMGGLEHVRKSLNYGKEELKKDTLYWMTDRTPHESLPMQKDGWRQFFRLVSSKLGVWYEAHSSKNPIGITPDNKFTKIVKESKFDK